MSAKMMGVNEQSKTIKHTYYFCIELCCMLLPDQMIEFFVSYNTLLYGMCIAHCIL